MIFGLIFAITANFYKQADAKMNMRGRKKMKYRKGQYITLENVFFFAIGIALVISVYAAFSGISQSISSAALQDQLWKEGGQIRSGVAKVFLAGNSTNSTVSLSMNVPLTLSGCTYKITVDGGNLVVSCAGVAASGALDLYGIETKVRNGAAYSSSGKINIMYSGGSILVS